MVSARELWAELEDVIRQEGLALFDIDMPSRESGTLRVFIAQPKGGGSGVTIDMCEKVSKRIGSDPQLSWILDRYALEVSSPGINRRLQRPEHFKGAVGERVKLVVAEDARPENVTLIGTIVGCGEDKLEIRVEGTDEIRIVALDDIQKARVDYLFE